MPRLAVCLPWLLVGRVGGLQTAVALFATGSLLTGADALNIAITGTSQGIGLDAAKRLVAAGHTVYHANRNAARSAEAAQQAGGGDASSNRLRPRSKTCPRASAPTRK